MKFYSVTNNSTESESLRQEYAAAHAVGVVRVGTDHLFFRVRLRTYFIPYSEIHRVFRRVMSVPAKMCCGKGEFAIENLVVCDEERELAVIQLPGTKAARLLMEELKGKMPHAFFSAPSADVGKEADKSTQAAENCKEADKSAKPEETCGEAEKSTQAANPDKEADE